jgi:hypothetical protein
VYCKRGVGGRRRDLHERVERGARDTSSIDNWHAETFVRPREKQNAKGEVIMATMNIRKEDSKVVSPAEWLAARKALLRKEKEFTRLRDDLSRQRRQLPWEKVEKEYVWRDRDVIVGVEITLVR